MYWVNLFLMGVVSASALSDVRYGKIYNSVTYPAVLLGIVLNVILRGEIGMETSLIGFSVGLVPFFFFFTLGLINGGDVKLLAAIGAIKGFPFILHAVFLSFLVAGFWALAKVIWAGQFLQTCRQIYQDVFGLLVLKLPVAPAKATSGTIPFGVAAAVGSVWALILIEGRLL